MTQYVSEVTAISTKGQVVLPKSIRDKLGLITGSKLIVFTDGENILMRPIMQPSLDSFSALLDASQLWAEEVGLSEADIDAAIKAVRAKETVLLNAVRPNKS